MKLKLSFTHICLAAILALSLFLHTYKILDNPPSLFSDEVDASYQAYVFNHCQNDYFGNKFPIHFHSFSDWRTSLYIYSVAIIQQLIGHTDLSTRLPSAIFGTLSIFIFFLIIKQLLNNSRWGLIGAFLLTLSPWLTHYSRIGFEVSGMIFVLLLGFFYWIKFIQINQNKYLYLSIIFFISSIYFYSTAKLFLVFIFIAMYLLWFKRINSTPNKIKILVILLAFLISLPFLVDTVRQRSGYRFSYINIFSDPTVPKTIDYFRQQDSAYKFGDVIGLKPTLTSKIFHNKIQQWSDMFIKNYFSSFSSEFLFLRGDGNLRHGFQTYGYLLYPDILFILLGFSVVIKRKPDNNQKIIILFATCLVCAPIPFALTRDSVFPHGTRLILMLPFLTFFSLIGIKYLYSIFKSKLLIGAILSIYSLSFINFAHQYFYHYPMISAREWHYGIKKVVQQSILDKDKYGKIFYSNSYEPFMPFFLNYSEYLPSDNNCSPAKAIKWDNNEYFTGMQAENKFYLGNIEWSVMFTKNPTPNTLYVVPQKDMIKIKNSLNEYNKSHPKQIHMNQINKFEKRYTEQEVFYFLTFNYDQ